MSRVTERLIVHTPLHKYLLPALPSDQLLDQFACKPTGSITAALIAITHHDHVTRVLESSVYMFYGLSHCIAQYSVFRLYDSALVTIILKAT